MDAGKGFVDVETHVVPHDVSGRYRHAFGNHDVRQRALVFHDHAVDHRARNEGVRRLSSRVRR